MKPNLILGCGSIAFFLLVSSSSLQADVLDNWTTNQVSTNYFGLDCVVYGSNRYVAYGEYSDYGVILTSEDGKDWILRSNGGGLSGSGLSFSISLVYTGGRFFALGGFGASAVSADGINWTVFSHGWVLSGAAFGAGEYVAVGSGSGILTSANGVAWTASANFNCSDIAYGAGSFVAIGNNNGITYTSPDGFTWDQQSIPGGSHVSFFNGKFIVPFGNGTNLISTYGDDWTPQKTGLTNALGKVTYANGLFLATAGGHLATSTDGINWVQYPQALPGNSLRGQYVATDGARLVTVGGVYTNSGFPNYYSGYTYYSDVFAAVRMTNSSPVQVALSGLVGRSYQIQSADVLMAETNNWKTNTTLQLPSNPYVWTDLTATNSQRFYRTVLLP